MGLVGLLDQLSPHTGKSFSCQGKVLATSIQIKQTKSTMAQQCYFVNSFIIIANTFKVMIKVGLAPQLSVQVPLFICMRKVGLAPQLSVQMHIFKVLRKIRQAPQLSVQTH